MKILKNPTDKNFLILVQNFCQLGFLKFSFLWEKDFFWRKVWFFSQIWNYFIYDEISINITVMTSEYPSYLNVICIRNQKNIISPSYYLYFFSAQPFQYEQCTKNVKKITVLSNESFYIWYQWGIYIYCIKSYWAFLKSQKHFL